MELRMKMRLKRRQSWLRICGSIFAILHIVYSPAVADFYTCFPGIEPSAGVTIPRGDINLEVGADPVPIYCHLNPEHKYFKAGYNASHLTFYATSSVSDSPLGDNDGNRLIPSKIVNATTIQAVYDPKVQRKDQVSCKINTGDNNVRGICQQHFFVGVNPLPPENFKCISENWQNLNCTWDEPENPVKTTYSLSYIEPGRYARFCCPDGIRVTRGCNMLGSGTVHRGGTVALNYAQELPRSHSYRKTGGKLVFEMCRENGLGITPYYFALNFNRDIVRPARARGLTLESKTPTSLNLVYKIPSQLVDFPPGLVSAIRYRSEFDSQWKEVDTTNFNLKDKRYEVELTDLFASAEYTVEVRLLSGSANSSESRLWSPKATTKSKTLPSKPSTAPVMPVGSFEIVGGLQDRTIYVYWQQITKTKRNGEDFRYSVTEVFESGNVRPINPVNVTATYAVFPHISLQNHSFYVASQNEMGFSPNTSSVFVAHHDKLRGFQPRSFTKIAYSEQLFEVSWIPPVNEHLVHNYTVFWCRSDNNRDRPYQCDGYLDWLTVPRRERIVNITLPTPDIYQFAVAANSWDRSSGMIWATCTILHNKVVGKLKTVSVDSISKDTMKVRWRLDCSDRVGIVTGYRIKYCPLASPDDTADCVGRKELNITTGPDKDKVTITGLNPWTHYKVGVSVLTRAGESELSDYLVNRTRRDRPGSPPTELRSALLSRNEVRLTWGSPTIPNGPIESFEVRTNFTDFAGHLEATIMTIPAVTYALEDGSGFEIDIPDLQFNIEYGIGVRACVNMVDLEESVCGFEWAETKAKTGIGRSGRMPSPLVTFKNSTQVFVEWGHLFHKGGPIKQFDLKITHQNLGLSKVVAVDAMHNSYSLSLADLGREQDWIPDCFNDSITNLYNFSIRAITFDPKTEDTFAGDWSPIEVTPAYCKAAPPVVLIVVLCIFIPLAIIGLAVYGHRIYFQTCNTMSVLDQVNEKIKRRGDSMPPSEPAAEELQKMEPSNINWIKPIYVRNGSREAKQTLLPEQNPKRNASGSSNNSTSGQGSSLSSDFDENESPPDEHQPSAYLRMPAPMTTAPETVNSSRLLVSDIGPWPETSDLNPDSLPQMHGPDPHGAPLGYSRVGMVAQNTDGNLPLGQVETLPSQLNHHQPRLALAPTINSGYVAIDQIRDAPRQQLPPPQQQRSLPPSGYITLAQACKAPSTNNDSRGLDSGDMSMDFLQQQQQQQPSSLDGYSKVGLSQDHRPADNLFSHPSSSKTGFDDGPGPESLDHRFDDRLGPMLPAATSPDYRLSSLPMSFGEDTGDNLPAPPELNPPSFPLSPSQNMFSPKVHPLPPLQNKPISSISLDQDRKQQQQQQQLNKPSHGYVQAQVPPANLGAGEETLMSPKSLQVESRSPYSKVFTSVQNSKSSMV